MIKNYIYFFITALAISLAMIPIILYISKKYGLYDRIDERKIHNGNISRLGGLAIFLGFIIAFSVWIVPAVTFPFRVHFFIAAAIVAFLTGFIDDFTNLKARYKLLAQVVVGIIVAMSGLLITKFQIYNLFTINFGPFSYVITVLWVVTFMNAINLLDGMDGLASGIVFFANIFVFIIAVIGGNIVVASISAIMAGAILGFFIFNFPPAKIFMGDGGAYFLGFMYATIPLMGIKKSSVATLFLFPLIMLLVPLTDIIMVIGKRIKSGYAIFIADKNHLHHRLMSLGLSIKGILLIMYVYTIILGLISILLIKIHDAYSFILMILIFLIMGISLFLLNQAEKLIESKDDECEEKLENNDNSI